MSLITELTANAQADIMGQPGHEEFMQAIKGAFQDYKSDVWATAPRFTPYSAKEIGASSKTACQGSENVGTIDIPELKEETIGLAGRQGSLMNLDDVRKHVEK